MIVRPGKHDAALAAGRGAEARAVSAALAASRRAAASGDRSMNARPALDALAEDPAAWLAAARTCPALARALFSAAVGAEDSDRSSPECWDVASIRGAVQAWFRRPPWGRVAAALRSEFDEAGSAPAIKTAALAQSVSAIAGWGDPDAAYWLALLSERSTAAGQSRAAPSTEDEEASVQVARLLASPARERALVHLRLAHPKIDWASIAAEARIAAAPASPPALDPTMLALLAETAAQRQEIASRDGLLELWEAPSPEAWVRIAAGWLRSLFGASAAVWIDAKPSGFGAVGSVKDSAESFVGGRADFEARQLSAAFRSSRELLGGGRTPLGRVYFTQPPDEEWFAWARTLGACAERWIARDASLSRAPLFPAEEFERGMRAAVAEFSAGAGHEINNPLGAILGQVEALRENELDQGRRRSLSKIAEQVRRVHRMIRDLHLLGRETLPIPEEVSLASVLDAALASAGRRRPIANVVVEPVDPAVTLLGRPADLARLFAELIVNAVEAAGPEGHARLAAVRPADDPTVVQVAVTDSGPGFTERDLERATTPFYSGRSAGRGLGMGLPVAYRLAEDHGGSIEIGVGTPTCVRVRLPILSVSSADTPRAEPPAPS